MIRIHDLAHTEAAKLCRTGAPVFLPVNPVEYHGPHLSLHNDRLVSEGLAAEVHAHLAKKHDWPFLLAADLEVGVEPTPGPGTRDTSFAVARDTILESCRSLHALGAKAVVIITWHGAPMHSLAMEAGLSWLRARGVRALNPFNEAFRELCRLDGSRFAAAFSHIEDTRERDAMMRDLRQDFHAGFFETSMALHYAPDSVSPVHRELPPCPPLVPDARIEALSKAAAALGRAQLSAELSMVGRALAWKALDPFPGYTGRPHRARAQAGKVFADVISSGYAEIVLDVIAGRREAPAPPMRWVAALTLNGRIRA